MTDQNTAQMVVDLRATDDAVRANGWVAPGLGVPGAPLDLLGSTLNPLSGLVTAGLGWFLPMVSFLGEGLTQLQGGNAASVSSGSQDFGGAGQDIGGVANSYRDLTSAQTSNWSGAAATEYRDAGAQHAEGITGLGQASTMTGSAIIGAGQVVAQAIAEVTELIAEGVAEIVPIMSQAVARAGETFGQSVAEAIPPCVGIAVEKAARIAAKLAALVASGDNLMKLVQGGMAVVDLINTALSSISQQSVQPGAAAAPTTAAAAQQQGGAPASTLADLALDNPGTSTPMSSSGGSSSGRSALGDLSTPTDSAADPVRDATHGSGVAPAAHSTVPDASALSAATPGSGAASPASGGAPIASLAPGGRVGAERGADTVRQGTRQEPAARAAAGNPLGAAPLGGVAGGRPPGDTDKEHERRFPVSDQHEEDVVVAPAVIESRTADY